MNKQQSPLINCQLIKPINDINDNSDYSDDGDDSSHSIKPPRPIPNNTKKYKLLRRCNYLFELKITCDEDFHDDACTKVNGIIKSIFKLCKSYYWLLSTKEQPHAVLFKCYCHYDRDQRDAIDSTKFNAFYQDFHYLITLKDHTNSSSQKLLNKCQAQLIVNNLYAYINGFHDNEPITKERAFNEAMKALRLKDGYKILYTMLGRFKAMTIKDSFTKEYTEMKYEQILERDLRNYYEGFPVNYDLPLVKGVIEWLNESLNEPTNRTNALVIVGETKIGKTHLINSKLLNPRLKLIEYQKGDFDFKTYDATDEIMFRVLDDPTFKTQGEKVIKALMGAETFRCNVKFDNKLIVPAPLIILFNKEKFVEFIKTFDETDWFLQNSKILPKSIGPLIRRTIQPNANKPAKQSLIFNLDESKIESFDTKLYLVDQPEIKYTEDHFLLHRGFGISSKMIKEAYQLEENEPLWLKVKALFKTKHLN